MNFKRPFLNFFEILGDFCRKIPKEIEKKPRVSPLCDNTHGLLHFVLAILQAFGIRHLLLRNDWAVPLFSLLCDNTHGLLHFVLAILQAFGIRSFASQNRSFLMSGRFLKRQGAPRASTGAPCLFVTWYYHIIPPIPAPAGAAGVSSLIFATTDSVVSKVEATLVAFCRALLVTLAGSRIPASIMST